MIVQRKIREKNGFTLMEQVVSILIVALLSGMVVIGVQLAVKAYSEVTDCANARALMTTVQTMLKNELAPAAKFINVGDSGSAVQYQSRETGRTWVIFAGDDITSAYVLADGTMSAASNFVQHTVATKRLHVGCDSITVESNGCICITGLRIERIADGKELLREEKTLIKIQ